MNINIAALLPLATTHKPSNEHIIEWLNKAWKTDKISTIQMLLYIRDKNNWAWRREFTRVALLWIKKVDEPTFNKIIKDFLLVWRWDDIFFTQEIINDKVLDKIKFHLDNNDTLLKKWLPKESSNPELARVIAKGIWLTMKEYRLATKKDEWPFINTLFRPINSYLITI